MNPFKTLIAPLALSCALFGMGSAQAALVKYTSVTAFQNALAALGVTAQTDNYSLIGDGDLGASVVSSAGSVNYTTSSSGGLWGLASDGWLTTTDAGDSIKLSGFGAGVYGIGGYFFGTDVDGNLIAADVQVQGAATDGDGPYSVIYLPTDTTSFLGFVSTTGDISELEASIIFATGGAFLTISNLMIGQGNVPEPTTPALVLAALAAAASVRRRKA